MPAVGASSLPEHIKQRLLKKPDQRITSEGVVVIKAQNHRSQEKNRSEALARLAELITSALHTPRKRIPTRPGRTAKKKRLEAKRKRGSLKKLRGKPVD